jgi:hypothetical protein
VLRPGGYAVSGAEVHLTAGSSSFTELSDALGEFEFAGLPSTQGDFTISAAVTINGIPHFYSTGQPIPPVPGGVVEVGDLVVEPAATVAITGRVVYLGAPVPGAEVFVFNWFYGASGTTGADGRFAIQVDSSLEGPLDVGARWVDGAWIRLGREAVNISQGILDAGDIILDASAQAPDLRTTVTGWVTLESGGSPAGIPVQITTTYSYVQTVTDTNGDFSVSAVPAREGQVLGAAQVEVEGEMHWGYATALPVEGGTTAINEIHVEPHCNCLDDPPYRVGILPNPDSLGPVVDDWSWRSTLDDVSPLADLEPTSPASLGNRDSGGPDSRPASTPSEDRGATR